MMEKFTLLLLLIISYLATGVIRAYALKKSIIDIPSARSSHTIPTPRGGGLAIVLSFYLGIAYLAIYHLIPWHLTVALSGGLLIALVGYWDDHRSVPARFRAFFHFIAAIWAVGWLHGFPVLSLGAWNLSLHFFGSFLAVFAIVWFINLYNFMDGIDGLAGSEAIFVSCTAGMVLFALGQPSLALLCFFLSVSCGGFLLWNWPPAKIFMGDVGSGFLGFIFAVFLLDTANNNLLPPLFWLILLAVFIADASYTLFRRVIHKQAWYEAHREHAYQRLIQKGINHRNTTLLLMVFNIFILAPLAVWVVIEKQYGFYIAVLVYFFLCILWYWITRNHSD